MRSFFVLRLFPMSYQFLGPFSEEQLCSEMKSGRISLSDLAYSPEDPGKWRRLFKFQSLLDCQPAVPSNSELIKFEDEAAQRLRPIDLSQVNREEYVEKTPSNPGKKPELASDASPIVSKKKIWYLQSQGSEFGPFNFFEVGKILESGKLPGKIYMWKEGLVNWMEVQSLEQLLTDLPQMERTAAFVIERGSNKRAHFRSPLVATVSANIKGIVHTALCLDISEGGLQIGKWDAKVELGELYSIVITPLGLTGIAPFTAESRVSWIDEKKEATGFRFKSFKKPGDQKILVRYLSTVRRDSQ